MKRAITCAWFLGVCFLFAGFTNEDLKRDFVAFDKAFIPPLALTKQGKRMPSMKGMSLLKAQWRSFKAKYYDGNPEDPEWKADFDRIDEAITAADGIVQGGGDLRGAHESLEEIRGITMNLRRRNHVEYYVDLLNRFHPLMEEIYHFGEDNQAPDLTPDRIESLEATVSRAEALWAKVEASPFDERLFQFDDRKTKTLRGLVRSETEALNRLKKAIETDDRPMIPQAARGVRPSYSKAYLLFGDFGR